MQQPPAALPPLDQNVDGRPWPWRVARLPVGLSRLAVWLRVSPGGGLLLALTIGAGAGLGAVAFRWLIAEFTRLLSGYSDYSAVGPLPNPEIPVLGRFFVLLTPVVAGLVYGPLVYFFAREARGHGVPEVMYAVARRGGRIPPQVAVVKALASALCIGGGGSVGREGPIVQIGSALGSTLGIVTRVPELRMRVLVACGAAGGIAATFNAPLAGVFFAMELILRDFAAGSFAMVVIASVTASVIGRAAFGDHPFIALPEFHVDNGWQYLLFAVLGLISGVVGVGFTRVLYLIEDACDWAWRWPEWLRPAVGGLLLGGVLLTLPELYGVGYPVLDKAVDGGYVAGLLILLLLGKIVATSLTIGIGGSGGVFAPSLFVGAMLGSAYGQLLHDVAPSVVGPAGAYGLIAMGAVFAGAARAPITAVIIMFELTGDYTIILPLMAAIVLATGVSRLLTRDTIYTLKLRRRGIDINEHPSTTQLRARRAGSIIEPIGSVVAADSTLPDVAALLAGAPRGQLAVLDPAGDRYLGVISAGAVAQALADGDHDRATARSVVESPPTVTTEATLQDTLTALEATAASAIPVLSPDHSSLVGWVSVSAILQVLRT